MISAVMPINAQNVFYMFGIVPVEFLFELYVFYFLFTLKLQRSKRFYLAAFIGLFCMLCLALALTPFYLLFGNTVWGRTIFYLVLFAASVLHVKLCFKETVWTILFCCNMAYVAQNLAYKLFLVLWCAGIQVGIFPFEGMLSELFYRLFYYATFALEIVALYFIFVRRMQKYMSIERQNYRILIVSVIITVVTIVLCSVEDIYFAALGSGLENSFDNIIYFYLREAGNLFSVSICVCVLLLLSGILEKRDLRDELDYMRHAARQKEKQYEISKDTIELINVKCHDMRHKVKAMLDSEAQGKLAKEVDEAISIYDANIHTGNRMLDVILTEKSLYCEKNGITFSCMADGEKLEFMEDGDLYCLFGNLVENAIEAVRNLSEEKKVINLTVKPKGELLIIQEDNYFEGAIEFAGGLPVTTKDDTNYHGFGMRSIKIIAQKYGGEISAFTDGNVFKLNILLPIRGD